MFSSSSARATTPSAPCCGRRARQRGDGLLHYRDEGGVRLGLRLATHLLHRGVERLGMLGVLGLGHLAELGDDRVGGAPADVRKRQRRLVGADREVLDRRRGLEHLDVGRRAGGRRRREQPDQSGTAGGAEQAGTGQARLHRSPVVGEELPVPEDVVLAVGPGRPSRLGQLGQWFAGRSDRVDLEVLRRFEQLVESLGKCRHRCLLVGVLHEFFATDRRPDDRTFGRMTKSRAKAAEGGHGTGANRRRRE